MLSTSDASGASTAGSARWQASATAPSGVRVMPSSERIRASTGKAVIDIVMPMNSAKLVNGTSALENRG